MLIPKITLVPPNPAPKRLTAFAPTKGLREHAMAFWNSNNPNGAEPTQPTIPALLVAPVKAKILTAQKSAPNLVYIAKIIQSAQDRALQSYVPPHLISGHMRKHIFGTRVDFAFRSVLIDHDIIATTKDQS